MCACERARCCPAIRRAAQWKLHDAASLSPGAFRTRAGNPFAVALLAWARVGEWEQQPAGGSGGTAQLSGSGGVELEECCWRSSEAAPRQGARARG